MDMMHFLETADASLAAFCHPDFAEALATVLLSFCSRFGLLEWIGAAACGMN
jgi:hypothetical protein